MIQPLNGLNPLAYIGVNPYTPAPSISQNRAPTANDSKGFILLTLWLDTSTNNVWVLVSLVGYVATWVLFGGPTFANDYVCNVGSAVPAANILNVLGDGSTITTSGSGNTITISALNTGTVTGLLTQDGHTVTPTAGIIQLSGSHGLNTTGTVGPNTATIAINNSITLGDLSVIAANSNALNASTGDINITAGNLKLAAFNAAGTQGVIKFSTRRFVTTDAMGNQFFGLDAGNLTMTGTNNLIVGGNGLNVNTTGHDNLLIGNNIMTTSTAGNQNTIVGNGTYNIGTDASNVIVGNASAILATTSSDNVIVGQAACISLLTGDNNVVLGFQGGNSWTGNESNNIIIGPTTGVVGESNTVRIANDGSAYTKTFIQGIRGITTVANDAIAVLISSTGQLGTVSSSARYKENIEDMGSDSNVLHKLRPVIFKYKSHPVGSKSVGLIAEEVAIVAPNLVVYDKDGIPETVKYHDLVPMLLNEYKKHCVIIADRDCVIANLMDRVRILEQQLISKSCH